MITFLGDHFVLPEVTKLDLAIASIVWGLTLGIGFLTTWTAVQQTHRIYARYGVAKLNSPYVWMIWLEISVCLAMSIISYLHLYGIIPPSLLFFFWILMTWSLQVQFLLQIIINRICILLPDRRKGSQIKIGTAIIITAINISVFCIWIPARLQISEKIVLVNDIWDRCEKVIYLIIDGLLNAYFIYIVQQRLVRNGFVKYDRLVKFNKFLVGFSLLMDVLIITTMSLKNSFVYIQFHPLAYIVKLNIEMSMADLIVKVCNSTSKLEKPTPIPTNVHHHFPFHRIRTPEEQTCEDSNSISLERLDSGRSLKASESKDVESFKSVTELGDGQLSVKMKREVHMSVEKRESNSSQQKSVKSSTAAGRAERNGLGESDEESDEGGVDEEADKECRVRRPGLENGMGVTTTVSAHP